MMEKGTLGQWTGEKWEPLEHEEAVRALIRDELATHYAAALADPDLGNEAALQYEDGHNHDAFRAASKALAGYLLERLTAQDQQI